MNTAAANKNIQPTLIVGLGATGLSLARFLARQGEPFEVVDSREDPPGLDALRAEWPRTRVALGAFDRRRFLRARRLVVSPGVPVNDPAVAAAVAAGAECVGDIELFARAVDAPVIAITGSNGKSTVTELVAAMLQECGLEARAGGNLGPPALDLLAAADTAPDFYVLELSSFQLETTDSLRPAAAVVLNLSADHLDRYADMGAYASAKARIYSGARVAVVNRDDAAAARLHRGAGSVIGFTLGEPGNDCAGSDPSASVPSGGDDFGVRSIDGREWLVHGDRRLLPADEVGLPGLHNRANVLAALALVTAVGADPARAARVAAGFTGLAHRMQRIAAADGITWYDDSKGTNVGATVAALRGHPAPVVLIAGGDGKGADFAPLAAAVAERARAVVLFGRDAPAIATAIGDCVPVECVADLDAAVERASAHAQPGDSVVLSPACASFDMFRDYRERGEAFAAAVRRLLA